MVKLTKIYTKTGDDGQTSLAAGRKISKSSSRISAIGEIDEVNAFLGLAVVKMGKIRQLKSLKISAIRVQNELFNVGSQLAVHIEDRRLDTPIIKNSNIELLEAEIDTMNTNLPYLNSFILPGGGEISAILHLARTVCRRAERSLVSTLREQSNQDLVLLPYINRLSDWLFVTARYSSYMLEEPELLWQT